METKIEEILGFNTSKGKDSESVTRRFYITAAAPEMAKSAFQAFANGLDVPANLELGDVALDEEKNANGLYFGTITFKSLNPKIKKKIDDGFFEVFGEKMSVGRKTASHERRFRIKADTAKAAKDKLENYIRNTAVTSGRLHINDISVDEEQDGDGFFTGNVVYNNPDHKGQSDKINGSVPAYGARWAEQYENGIHTSSTAEDIFELRGYSNAYTALQALKGAYQNVYVKEISVEEDSGGADKAYIGRIRRAEEQPDNNNDDNKHSISFEVSGSQTKMTHSLGTRGAWAANGMSPRNYGGLIGVTDDGVEGVDIDTAVSTFSVPVHGYFRYCSRSFQTLL